MTQGRAKERETGQELSRDPPPYPEQSPPVHFIFDSLGLQKDFKQYLIVNRSRPSVRTSKKVLSKHTAINQQDSRVHMSKRSLNLRASGILSGRPTSFSTYNT